VSTQSYKRTNPLPMHGEREHTRMRVSETHTHTHTHRERERERERDRFTHVFVRYTKHGEVQCAVTAVCGAGGTICRESRSILILRLIDFRDRHPGRWSRSRKARKGRCAPATGYKFRLEISVPLEDV
jgi:hypothetical protein